METVKKPLNNSVGIVLTLTVGLWVHSAQAAVTYSVDGWNGQFPAATAPPANAPWGPNGYPGDTVKLQSYAGSLDLTPGTQTLKINTLLWTIDYTYGGTATDPDAWSDLSFTLNLARNMTIDGVAGQIAQGGSLRATWDNDYLGLSAGTTVSFLLQGYKVDVTPLGLAEVGGSNFGGSNPWVQPSRDVFAQFEISAVPEPTAVVSGMLLLLPFGLSVFRRTHR